MAGRIREESDMLFDFLTEVKGEFGLVWRSPGQLSRPPVELTEDKMIPVRDAFLAACRRPYWRRVWIIQEILSATELQLLCGTKKLAWSYFSSTLRSIETACIHFAVDSQVQLISFNANGRTSAKLARLLLSIGLSSYVRVAGWNARMCEIGFTGL